jgi:hypothetical protein
MPQRTTIPTIARWKMRVTTTYNGADEVVEKKKKKKRSFVFYVPISIYNLLILNSRSSLFHNYRIWLWAFLAHGLPLGRAGFMQKPAQAQAHGPLASRIETFFLASARALATTPSPMAEPTTIIS